jgi:uncharacterized protein YdeI (YjbR/CyaY-like superfamily)
MTLITAKKEVEQKVPVDLRNALVAHPKAKTQWDSLTPLARRDFVTWIEGTKQPETRARRIAKAWSILQSGKRRPCCYSIMPTNFYKALWTYPKAKAGWSKLLPTERRDLVAWIDSPDDPILRNKRIEKACEKLAAGKRPL